MGKKIEGIKIFEEKHVGYKIGIKSLKGELYNLETRSISLNELEEIESKGKKAGKDKNSVSIDEIFRVLFILFGKDKKFFGQFNVNLLKDLISHVATEIKKNPEIFTG